MSNFQIYSGRTPLLSIDNIEFLKGCGFRVSTGLTVRLFYSSEVRECDAVLGFPVLCSGPLTRAGVGLCIQAGQAPVLSKGKADLTTSVLCSHNYKVKTQFLAL